MSEYKKHYSVLMRECLEYLTYDDSKGAKLFADLTFGAGGHTRAIASASDDHYVLSVDQDPDALANGKIFLKEHQLAQKVELLDTNFENIAEIINLKSDLFQGRFNAPFKFNGFLLDLGVSSHHFDSGERGFSFRFDADLDMRMNNRGSSSLTAKEIVNDYSVEDIENILKEYGEEKFAYHIARNIAEHRERSPIATTKDLENIIFHSYPKAMRYQKTSPATKSFQALRIVVNRELEVLESVLPTLLNMLAIGGRIAVISFHSLEDRIVKNIFKAMEKSDVACQVLTKKPILPQEDEVFQNSRSRSAKLRVIERVLTRKVKNKYASHSKL